MQGFVSPESFALLESITVLCMVVLGGMGHVAGVVLGALLLATLPELLRHTAAPVQQQLFGKVILDPESLRMLLFGLALILVMLLRPAGLWPSPTRRRELTRRARRQPSRPLRLLTYGDCSKQQHPQVFGGLLALSEVSLDHQSRARSTG